MAHANSILETEATTEKVAFPIKMIKLQYVLLRWLVLIWVARMLGPWFQGLTPTMRIQTLSRAR